MRQSKYLGKTFDHNWVCTHIGLANVQGKRAKAPGTRNYYYIFERPTSDKKAVKLIRLNSSEAAKVNRGELTVEELSKKRATDQNFTRKTSYHFIDKI